MVGTPTDEAGMFRAVRGPTVDNLRFACFQAVWSAPWLADRHLNFIAYGALGFAERTDPGDPVP
jgi:hypothetical protein